MYRPVQVCSISVLKGTAGLVQQAILLVPIKSLKSMYLGDIFDDHVWGEGHQMPNLGSPNPPHTAPEVSPRHAMPQPALTLTPRPGCPTAAPRPHGLANRHGEAGGVGVGQAPGDMRGDVRHRLAYEHQLEELELS